MTRSKAAEIIHSARERLALTAEKAGERSSTRSNAWHPHIGSSRRARRCACSRESRVGGGKRIAQELDRRQRENEVANGAAADHQDSTRWSFHGYAHFLSSERAWAHPAVDPLSMPRTHKPESPRRRRVRNRKAPPTFRRPCAPMNLVAQQVGHRYPDQPSHDHQIRQHRDEQPTRFRSQERRIKERLRGQQNKGSRARGQQGTHRQTAARGKIRSAAR